MAQILHGCATTTHATRAAIQRSKATTAQLSRIYGINRKTVMKWRRRDEIEDRRTGPKDPRSKALSRLEEAAVVAFRRHTLLPLDDCLYALQTAIPHLTRSCLYRCLKRHGISRLPDEETDRPRREPFKSYPIGYVHIDIAEVHDQEGRLCLFVAIDRTAKFTYVELHERATQARAVQFLRNLIDHLPYAIHTILTDNGLQFTRHRPRSGVVHPFDRVCRENDIDHRLTKVNHPWTNGQVERMNRTIKAATVKRYHYDSHDQLRGHVQDFIVAYNYAKRLKALKGLTPHEYICKTWTEDPSRFKRKPVHQIPKPYKY